MAVEDRKVYISKHEKILQCVEDRIKDNAKVRRREEIILRVEKKYRNSEDKKGNRRHQKGNRTKQECIRH